MADQEAQGKQAIEGAQKTEEEALFSGRGRGRGKYSTRGGFYSTRGGARGKGRFQSIKIDQPKDERSWRQQHRSYHSGGAQEGQEVESSSSNNYRRRNDLCFNCGKRGHFARDCKYKKGSVQGNVATSRDEENHSEEEWDMQASCATVEIEVEVEANQVVLSTSNQSRVDYSKNWIIDSGAASHMTGDEEKLLNLSEYKGNRVVVTADDTRLPIKQIGDAVITPRTNSEQVKVKNVLHVSGMKKNLLSVAQLTAPGNYVVFGPEDVKVYQQLKIEGTPIMKGEKKNSVYVMSAETAYVDRTSKNDTADLWHARLGHVSYLRLQVMMNKSMVKGLPKLEVRKDAVCAGCQYGKAHQLPYQESKFKAKEPLQLVHSDVFGKVKQSSIGGAHYMVTFIDDYSRHVWVYFMKEKSETLEMFKRFKKEVEQTIGKKIQCLRTDNGGEYTSKEFSDYLQDNRIRRQLTCPYTPQQNGVAERKNRHLGETCRSMLHAKNVPPRFWAECMKTAAHVINRLPQATLGFISPFEKLWNIKPVVSHFRVFGSVCYVFVPEAQRTKFDKKAVRCIFLGYDDQRKGWRCCDPNTGRCCVSRNVVFDEASSWWSPQEIVLPDSKELEEKVQEKFGEDTCRLLDTKEVVEKEKEIAPERTVSPWQTGVREPMIEETRQGEVEEAEQQPEQQLRRSTRERKPNPKYANIALIEASPVIEPENYEEAAQSIEWRKAMEEEIKALKQNQTWELVPKPNDVKPVSCKWVYKVKTRPDGKIERYKARLVARGFSQQYGIDYDETFSPVAKINTVRVLLALAASKSWKLWQMDVKNAFLHGEIDREIYMEQPCGFEDKRHSEYVCKLKKALYGLKQAPRAWYGKIAEFLVQSGYSMTVADSSLFVKTRGNKVAIVLVYVDDLIVTGDDIEEILQTKENLSVRFQMKELGELKHFLGLEVDRTKEGIFLCQQKYASDLLKKFGMLECKPISTPMEMNARLCSHKGKDLTSATMYRKLVGSLIYLTLSRPDISFAVGVVNRFMQNPKKSHLEAVRRILKYVKGTLDYGILYKSGTECKVVGYCDADYAGCHDTRRSTTGYEGAGMHKNATREDTSSGFAIRPREVLSAICLQCHTISPHTVLYPLTGQNLSRFNAAAKSYIDPELKNVTPAMEDKKTMLPAPEAFRSGWDSWQSVVYLYPENSAIVACKFFKISQSHGTYKYVEFSTEERRDCFHQLFSFSLRRYIID
ncbi:hypothetical protein SLEP1_g19738 [Rubroshorea leprosula]|uniref:Uncharacterized protein n=1 Tax=Rubroshorea leprosula TaxID=152421 RepID=A0AAV5JAY1_9ROSI|nr:hypothetical protein SLEP1_g19738 [Rubroshorea leprosula]